MYRRQLHTPVQLARSRIAFIAKNNRLSASRVDNRRAIWMANNVAEAIGAPLRPIVSNFANPVTMAGQCGMGWHGSGCDDAHLTLNAQAEAATAQRLSYSMISVDIKAAYDSTVHRMAHAHV